MMIEEPTSSSAMQSDAVRSTVRDGAMLAEAERAVAEVGAAVKGVWLGIIRGTSAS